MLLFISAIYSHYISNLNYLGSHVHAQSNANEENLEKNRLGMHQEHNCQVLSEQAVS